jgi:hypothetical protein
MTGTQEMVAEIVKWALLTAALFFAIRHLANKISPAFEGIAKRVRRFGPAEFAEVAPQSEMPATSTTPSDGAPTLIANQLPDGTDTNCTPPQNPFYTEQEQNLRQWFDENIPAQRRDEQLLRSLAIHKTQFWFERLNYWILGSQLSALTRLNTGAGDEPTLRYFYNTGAAQNPSLYQNDNFERWMTWLITYGLVAKQFDHYQISPAGREFLVYLAQVGHPLVRTT